MTNIALCGAGMISMAHAAAARQLGHPVVAVASRSADRAQQVASTFDSTAVTYDQLPGTAHVVVVATPPQCHAVDAVRLLDAGAAVLLEKPLCRTMQEADQLVAAAARHNGRLLYGENLAYAPVVQRMIALVPRIGPLTHLEVRSLQGLPTWGSFTSDEWGGGALFDLGVHPLALALLVAGDDTLVDVVADLEHGGRAVDDLARVTLRFASSLVATVECSWRHQTTEWDLEVASDSGVVRLELMPEVALEHNGEPVPLAPTRAGGDPRLEQLGYVAQLEALGAAARGEPSWCDAGFGRRVLEVVAAAYTSAGLGGAPVPLPFTGRRDLTPLELWRGA